MKKEEKLKIAIDFISDYLSETPEVVEEIIEEEVTNKEVSNEDVLVETESDDHLTRAYTLMKKLEARDIENAKIEKKVKTEVEPLKEALKKAKSKYEEGIALEEERLIERKMEGNEVGVTIDKNTGNMVKVVVESLTTIKDLDSIKKEINGSKLPKAIMDVMVNNPIDLTTMLNEDEEPLTHNED